MGGQHTDTHRGPFHVGAIHFPIDTTGMYGGFVRWKRRHRKLFYFGIIPLLLLIAIVASGSYIVDGPLRTTMERRMNERLKGYTAHLAGVSFHPIGLSVTLKGLALSQNAHPNPPVVNIRNLTAGLHWGALLHGALVADFLFDRPQLSVNLLQLQTEAKGNTKEHAKSWQAALESIYPLKINRFRVRGGDLTYIDKDPNRPMRLTQLNVVAENIRNVRFPDRSYPSIVHLQAEVFGKGGLRVDGHANFLQEPFAGFDSDIELKHIELDRVKPAAEHANLQINKGILDASGHVEYAPDIENLHLKTATINGVEIEYLHKPQTENAEQQRAAKVQQVAKDVANKPKTLVLVDLLKIEKSTVGYKDETKEPGYRVFLSDVNATIKNFSNQSDRGATGIHLTGAFMGSGKTKLDASFFPEAKTANMDVALEIARTRMTDMNDLFRTYGDFDIKSGLFSFYSELSLKKGTISGYMKPLFEDMHVTDNRSDQDKSLFHSLYIGLVNGIADLLVNRDGAVATKAEVSGSTSNPQTSTLQIVLKMIQNAFIKAILPGFEKSITGSS